MPLTRSGRGVAAEPRRLAAEVEGSNYMIIELLISNILINISISVNRY